MEGYRGNIWCYLKQVQRCVGVFNVKHSQVESIRQYKIPGNIRGIYASKMDHKGRVLVATDGMGLAIFDTASKIFNFLDNNTLPPSRLTSSAVTAICEDHNGCIWVGTMKGLNKIEKDGITVKQYSQNKINSTLLSDWYINDIKEDKHGVIWFTTRDNGIGRIDPRNDSVCFFSIAQGLPTSMFEELGIDDDDNLWALSKMGLVDLNVVTLQNKLFTEDQGFPSPDEINTIHYSKYTKKLYILTPYAIFEIDAKNSNHNIQVPPTTITGLSVFDKERSVTTGRDITLKYNENFIDIRFACLLFHSNKQIKYAYKMEGIDKDWVYCNYSRNAHYTHLPPGNYVFKVKAQSPEGTWNNTPTLLTILIKPPLWQTWWFYLLETMACMAVAYYSVSFYTGRKLAKQKIEIAKLLAVSNERTRIAAEMHDELGSGLTSIRMLSEIAGGKIDHDLIPKSEIEKIER